MKAETLKAKSGCCLRFFAFSVAEEKSEAETPNLVTAYESFIRTSVAGWPKRASFILCEAAC
jgi:hypothetical protein